MFSCPCRPGQPHWPVPQSLPAPAAPHPEAEAPGPALSCFPAEETCSQRPGLCRTSRNRPPWGHLRAHCLSRSVSFESSVPHRGVGKEGSPSPARRCRLERFLLRPTDKSVPRDIWKAVPWPCLLGCHSRSSQAAASPLRLFWERAQEGSNGTDIPQANGCVLRGLSWCRPPGPAPGKPRLSSSIHIPWLEVPCGLLHLAATFHCQAVTRRFCFRAFRAHSVALGLVRQREQQVSGRAGWGRGQRL